MWVHALHSVSLTLHHAGAYLDPRNLPPIAKPKDGWYAQNDELVKVAGGVVVFTISAPHLFHLAKFLIEAIGKLFEK